MLADCLHRDLLARSFATATLLLLSDVILALMLEQEIGKEKKYHKVGISLPLVIILRNSS